MRDLFKKLMENLYYENTMPRFQKFLQQNKLSIPFFCEF